MPSVRDVAAALNGAWRLLCFDPGGMAWFDISLSGFWRSFFAAVPLAPAYALLVWLDLAQRTEPVDPAWAVVVSVFAYGLKWAAFPVAAIFITRLLRLTDRYFALIIAYNWTSVPQVMILLPAVLIDVGGILPGDTSALITVAATVYVLVYQWFVTRTALGTTSLTALGVVVLEVLLGAFLDLGADGLI